MHIVDVSAFYSPRGGGVRTYVDRKLEGSAALGHDITVVVPAAADDIEQRPGGGRIVGLASPVFPLDRRYRYFGSAEAVHAALDALQPDFVEASSPWRSARFVAEWPGNAPRALVMHADPLASYAYRWFDRFADRATIDRRFDRFWRHLRQVGGGFDAVVTANSRFARRLSSGGIGAVTSVPMGIEPGRFSPALRDEALRANLLARCRLGPDATLLIGVGRHSAEKRWPLVVDACSAVRASRPIGLILIGEGRDTGRLIRHLDGNPHVHLLAPLTERHAFARLLASCDALVHGCESETFGLAAAEAVASGLPIIVPDDGGVVDIAAMGCAETYRAADPRSAAAAIARLLARGPDTIAAARGKAGGVRTMDAHFRSLFSLYCAIASGERLAA
jgi:alpha-1,6-mannosyltransferase